MTLSSHTTLTLAPADLKAKYPLDSTGFFLPADAQLHLRAEIMNDVWLTLPDEQAYTSSVEGRAVQAIERAAHWADGPDGHFALVWITAGDDLLFAMIGEGLVTLEPDTGVCRVAGLPLDLAVVTRSGPAVGTGEQLVVGSWNPDDMSALVLDVMSLDELIAALS